MHLEVPQRELQVALPAQGCARKETTTKNSAHASGQLKPCCWEWRDTRKESLTPSNHRVCLLRPPSPPVPRSTPSGAPTPSLLFKETNASTPLRHRLLDDLLRLFRSPATRNSLSVLEAGAKVPQVKVWKVDFFRNSKPGSVSVTLR